MTGHTPGPWFVTRKGFMIETGVEALCEPGPDGEARWLPVCTMEKDWDAQTAQANARLIAAAPDMLEVLEELLWLREQEFKSAVKKKNAYERAMSMTPMGLIKGTMK
jgi:hypothetical protein